MLNKISSHICFAACLCFLVLATGCSMNINGSVKTSSNEVVEHDLKTINGSVKVAEGSIVNGDCKTVNGSVELGRGAKADNLKTVNGSIRIKPEASVEGEVETVNGKITAEGNNVIGGDLETVNGGVKLGEGTEVKGVFVLSMERYNLPGHMSKEMLPFAMVKLSLNLPPLLREIL